MESPIARKNFRLHLFEGMTYGSTGVLLSAQTIYPALILRLGGTNTHIGLIPLVVFLAFFLPQIFSANYITRHPYRLPWTLWGGFFQRLQILILATVTVLFGNPYPGLALVLILLVFAINQTIAGITSPAWFDLVAKTVAATDRGRLMGWRQSLAGLFGIGNGLFVSYAIFKLPFPYSYGQSSRSPSYFK